MSFSASPRFSIVVPLYNKSAYIEHTLATVLSQTLSDFEVLVIDDGSTDDGPSRVAAIDDPRIHLHRTANGGVSQARNRGIGLARGEWIAFLDADDWLHPRYLEILAGLISMWPSTQMIASRYLDVPFDADLRTATLAEAAVSDAAPELISDLPQRWLQGPTFITSSVAVYRTLLLDNQPCFPVGESFGEDLDAWFRLSAYTSIALHPAQLVWHFIVPGSLTSQVEINEEPPFLQRLLDQTGKTQPRRRSVENFVRRSRLLFARVAIAQGRRTRAIHILKKCFSWLEPRWWLTAMLLAAPASTALRLHERHNPRPAAPQRKGSNA